MYELTRWVPKSAERQGGVRVIPLTHVIRSAHVMPNSMDGGEAGANRWYVNNYIDWDQYQVLYDPEFISNGIRQAHELSRQFERRLQ